MQYHWLGLLLFQRIFGRRRSLFSSADDTQEEKG